MMTSIGVYHGRMEEDSCVLCGNMRGLEVRVENNKIVRVRGDKDNPLSQGYA
jgi:hypothetical protein